MSMHQLRDRGDADHHQAVFWYNPNHDFNRMESHQLQAIEACHVQDLIPLSWRSWGGENQVLISLNPILVFHQCLEQNPYEAIEMCRLQNRIRRCGRGWGLAEIARIPVEIEGGPSQE
jgi:hypothetical protein